MTVTPEELKQALVLLVMESRDEDNHESDLNRIGAVMDKITIYTKQAITAARLEELNKYVFGADARVIQTRIAELSLKKEDK